MKKCLLLTVAILLVAALLVGCTGNTIVVQMPESETPNSSVDNGAATEDKTPEAPEAAEGALKLGLAVMPSVSGSAAATADENGKADYDITLAAVLVDDAGVIRDCIIDSVGTSISFDAAGQIVEFDPAKEILTKNELGDNYGMKAYAGAAYEWYEQADAVAQFAVGKTVEEMITGAVGEDGKAKDVDLASVATIYIGGYVKAIEKAVANAQHLGSASGDALKLSVINTAAATAAGEENGAVELTVDVAAVTLNGQTITGCYIDALQAKVAFDVAGALATDVSAALLTKNELGENYGMKAYAGAAYEWNEQAANFSAYITGKTAADVAGIAIAETTKPADGTDLAATVTISIAGFQALIAKIAQ